MVVPLTTRHELRYWSKNSNFFHTPPAFDARYGVPVGIKFGMEKLEWCGYSIITTFWGYDYSFWDTRTWETAGQTDIVWQHRPNLCIA